MNAKKSLIWFGVGIVWLAGLVLSFAHASQIVDDPKSKLIWFGASILWACLGVFGAVKLNTKK